MGKLKFTQAGPESGDCTTPYDVEWNADGIRSVSAFVAAVLLEKRDEWGSIYLIDERYEQDVHPPVNALFFCYFSFGRAKEK